MLDMIVFMHAHKLEQRMVSYIKYHGHKLTRCALHKTCELASALTYEMTSTQKKASREFKTSELRSTGTTSETMLARRQQALVSRGDTRRPGRPCQGHGASTAQQSRSPHKDCGCRRINVDIYDSKRRNRHTAKSVPPQSSGCRLHENMTTTQGCIQRKSMHLITGVMPPHDKVDPPTTEWVSTAQEMRITQEQ